MIFTNSDKALLDRAARLFDAEAAGIGWESVLDSKKRKALKVAFDRATRDARDLRALGQRLRDEAKVNGAAHVNRRHTTERRAQAVPVDIDRRFAPDRRIFTGEVKA